MFSTAKRLVTPISDAIYRPKDRSGDIMKVRDYRFEWNKFVQIFEIYIFIYQQIMLVELVLFGTPMVLKGTLGTH